MSGALITNIQRFSTHDGEGIRTVVFFKGCPMRCKWCHNPETQRMENEFFYVKQLCIGCRACESVCDNNAHLFNNDGIHVFKNEKCKKCFSCVSVCPAKALEPVAVFMTSDEIMETVLSDKVFFGDKGGITLSGGEPLVHPDICTELLTCSKNNGITTAVETSGYVDDSVIIRISGLVDCFFFDIKDTDDMRHFQNTGVHNTKIINNLQLADSLGCKTIIRCILVNGVNTNKTHYAAVSDIFHSLRYCVGVEMLAYHAFGGSKREQIDGYDDGVSAWIPEDNIISEAKQIFESLNVPVIIS